MSDARSAKEHRGVAVVGGPARTSVSADTDSDVRDLSMTPTRAEGLRQRRVQPRTVAPGTTAPRTPGWLVPLLAMVTISSVLVAVVFGVKWSDLSAQNDSRNTMQHVAKDFLGALTNFTPTSVDADFRTISTYATGEFAKQSNQFFGSSIRQKLEQAQAWSKGQVRYLYVQSLDGSQGTVYAEVDQTYANNKVTTPVTDTLQVVLGMADVGGVWKISAVTVLQPPSSSSAPAGGASSAGGR